MTRIIAAILILSLSACIEAIEAESPKTSCEGIMRLVDKEKFKEALEEARWCVEALESSLQGSVASFFSANVAGWQRTDVRQENALGMGSIIGEYSKDGKTLTVTLIGSKGSGGAFAGALGGLAKMGLMQQGRRFRVQGLKASADPQGQITITLDDGSFITVKSPQYSRQEEALKALEPFLDAFPFADINDQRS
ncbi:hypothetical protein HBA55_30135 [Pseudomaricurvus alkylphenolicus]|uniref:hypothetical protein n=1 Tax=Pseudomaricurvus alkylphenolicus TaxID=1306991 RepID=UPI00141FB6FF|nr:hypothetical protein [Pseudomaricurvus alkylphenolicus]NIB43900.1 hypothetical protein [Pseudomaricurvus alkylphenolicus]